MLDEKLNFSEHINEKLKQVTKGINLLRKLNLTLPRSSLLIRYKSFIKPHLDYGDIAYDQPNNSSMENETFSIYDPLEIKLLNRLRVDLSHLNKHKFRHNFADILHPLCSGSLKTESMAQCFLRCRYHNNIRIILMNELNDIDNSITSRQPNELLRIILYGDSKFKYNVNKRILIATIQFIKNSNRFNQSLI